MKITILFANGKEDVVNGVTKLEFDGSWNFVFYMKTGETKTIDRCIINNLIVDSD